MKCLLIQTKDNRKFITYEKYYDLLLEYAKIFNSSLVKIELKEGKPLSLEELVASLCDSHSQKEELIYKIKQDKISVSEKIKSYIQKKLNSNKTVCTKELKEKFKEYDISDSTFYNHIRLAKSQKKDKKKNK